MIALDFMILLKELFPVCIYDIMLLKWLVRRYQ